MAVFPVESTSLEYLEDISVQCEWPDDTDENCTEKAEWITYTKLPCCGKTDQIFTCNMHKSILEEEMLLPTVGICANCNTTVVISFNQIIIKIEKI